MLDKLYFIAPHCDAIREALDAGCRLVQLRIKQQPVELVLQQAIEAKQLCDLYNARLIINDHPEVAKSVNAYGVHVGLLDRRVEEVRDIVGENMIIGGTANTFEHIVQRKAEGVDYIGLGPYRFTATKEKLSPILGLEGYQRILQQCKEAGISLPIVAIGGILLEDVAALFDAGVHTIALSGALINAPDKKALVDEIARISHFLHSPIINDQSHA